MRWITDWSWVYNNGSDAATIREYQHRIHEFIRPFNAISMCTVLCEKVQRGDLLAMLVDHRRVAKTVEATRRAVAAHA
jgi:hypothetical protein